MATVSLFVFNTLYMNMMGRATNGMFSKPDGFNSALYL